MKGYYLLGSEAVWCGRSTVIVLESRVLRRIFGHKRKEEIGGWRKLNNKELHNL
jgi:hypothetical protein